MYVQFYMKQAGLEMKKIALKNALPKPSSVLFFPSYDNNLVYNDTSKNNM